MASTASESRRRHRASVREQYVAYKRERSCVDCAMSFALRPECCEWHHVDAVGKEANPSRFVSGRWGWKKVLAEIAKCIPLCSNCHKTRHANVELFPGTPESGTG